jgi:hypothetical protein
MRLKHADTQRSGKSEITCTRSEALMPIINPLIAKIKLQGSLMQLD